jgi:predicted RNA-binding protein YlxR (DUF448 family)
VERTCIACRKKYSWDGHVSTDTLVRIIRQGLVLIPDPDRKLSGRGAWVHRDCVTQAIERKLFKAAFRSADNFDHSQLQQFIADELTELDAKVMKLK